MKLMPYLYFEGNCEKAINYYQFVFDGNIAYKDYYKNAPINVPESHKDKILHCELDFAGNMIMACDAFPGQKIEDGNGYVLSIGFDDENQAREIFTAFAKEGKISMPFEKQFWGTWLGQLTDKFGKNWMISTNIHG